MLAQRKRSSMQLHELPKEGLEFPGLSSAYSVGNLFSIINFTKEHALRDAGPEPSENW